LNGRAGGYRLARSAAGLSLLEIVEAVDGPVEAGVPQIVTGTHGRIERRLQAACDGTAEIIRRNLGRVSVADLARNEKGDR
jgi:DNA-binding IscR family transcriptional regulator